MKRMILTAALVLGLCAVLSAQEVIAEGKTFSALGDYKIQTVEQPVTLNGKELKAFTIAYENTGMKVTVAVEKTAKCKKYYVLSDNLSVQYVCNRIYFGVERIGKELEKEGITTSDEALDRVEYYHQKVLTCGGNTDQQNSSLIAANFPFLFKDPEGVLAAK
jgi:hypothetical protein